MHDVTFLCPNKKVTKEVVRGEAFRANSRKYGAIAGGKRSAISAIGSECLAPDDFFGYFLVRTQESNTCRQIAKLKFETRWGYKYEKMHHLLCGGV